MLQVDLNSWNMASAKQQNLTTLCNVPKKRNETIGINSHVATLFKPLHHGISPLNICEN
jgi:hypothetical protein